MHDAEQSLAGQEEDVFKPGRGTPQFNGNVKPADVNRFLDKITLAPGPMGACWIWTAHKDKKGYGQFWFDGVAWWSHRWAFALWVGDIPDGQTINHKCRNPSCVRPDHLETMSRVDNTNLGNHDRRVDAGIESEAPF